MGVACASRRPPPSTARRRPSAKRFKLPGLPAWPARAGVPFMRTHFCGLVDETLIGQSVTLCGWADVARNLGGVCFIDLRDHQGIAQVVAEPSEAAGN